LYKMDIKGAVVIITGSAQGIGLAVAEHLLAEGAKVCISDLLVEAGEKARKELAEKFGQNSVTFIRCDVTNLDQLTALYDGAEQYFGEPVTIFCNNAGINHTAGWKKCLDVNIVGLMQATYLAMERMSKENGGKGGLIINTASAAGIIFGDQDPALVEANSYIVAKHGVIALTRSLGNKINFAKTGVMVQCVCPNFVDTNLIREGIPDAEKAKEKIKKKFGICKPDDVAKAFLHLIRDCGNGATLVVFPGPGGLFLYPDLSVPILTFLAIGAKVFGRQVFNPVHQLMFLLLLLVVVAAIVYAMTKLLL